MNRRNFLTLTGTFTSGTLLLPTFLHAFGAQTDLVVGEQSLIFIQLNGGNDGLNTFVPFENPLYYALRPKIALQKETVLSKNSGMAFHPALSGFAQMQQNGDLSVIQNVGYPNPVRSHFRSQEIWQTAVDSDKYHNQGWHSLWLAGHALSGGGRRGPPDGSFPPRQRHTNSGHAEGKHSPALNQAFTWLEVAGRGAWPVGQVLQLRVGFTHTFAAITLMDAHRSPADTGFTPSKRSLYSSFQPDCNSMAKSVFILKEILCLPPPSHKPSTASPTRQPARLTTPCLRPSTRPMEP